MAWISEARVRPVIFRPGFQSKKRLFGIFFNHAGPLVVDILPGKTVLTSRHYIGTVLPKVVVAVHKQRPNVGTMRILLFHDSAAPHKARATIQYLEGEKLQAPPTLQTWLHFHRATFGYFPLWKLALVERSFCKFKTLQERWIHNFLLYPVWSTTTPSRNG